MTWVRSTGWWVIVSGVLLMSALALMSASDAALIGSIAGGAGALFFFLFLGIWLLRSGSREAPAG